MKIPIILFLFVILACSAKAQDKYISNPALDKFVGTWTASKDGQDLKLILKKSTLSTSGLTEEVLNGYYVFKKGNTTIDESTADPALVRGTNIFRNSDERREYEVSLDYQDHLKKKGGEVLLKQSPGEPNEIIFTPMNHFGDIRFTKPGDKSFDQTFTLPTSLILKKQL